MNTFTESIWAEVRPHGWKYRLRGTPIRGAVIHATRSGIKNNPTQREYEATKNWAKSPNNRTIDSAGNVSAGSFHATIGGGGKMCIVLPDEFYPTWSAGHFDLGGFWSLELAQGTNDTPYDPLDLERAEHELAKKAKQYDFEPKCITYMHGDNREGEGIGFHDASRNGDLLGKSDPGDMPPFNDRPAWVRNKIAPLVSGGGAGDVFKAHNKSAKYGTKVGGWKGVTVPAGTHRMWVGGDCDLPPEARMVRMEIAVRNNGALAFEHGSHARAGAIYSRGIIEAMPNANGDIYFVALAPVTFDLVDSLGYWSW